MAIVIDPQTVFGGIVFPYDQPSDLTRLETLEKTGDQDLGTGIYWFVREERKYEQVFVPDLTLESFRGLAASFGIMSSYRLDAYRWVPQWQESADALIMQTCGGNACTSDLECVDSACRCIEGRCRRK